MATKVKLRQDIKKLKEALKKPLDAATKTRVNAQIKKLEDELSGKSKPSAATSAKTKILLGKLQKFVDKNAKYGSYKGTGESNLRKDAVRTALKIGRRESKGQRANQYGSKGDNKGNVYYEYRTNRHDVKQPSSKQKYPILEDGGEMARGGFVSKGELVWRRLSSGKRLDFLNRYFTPQITPRSQEILVGKDFNFLPKEVKIKIESYYANLEEGDYESGGMMADGGYMAAGGGVKHSDKYVVYGVTKVDREVKIIKELDSSKLAENWLNRFIDRGLDDEFEKMGYMPKSKFEKEKANLKYESGGYMAGGGGIKKQEWVAIFQKGNQRKVIPAFGNSKEEAIRDAMMSRNYYDLSNEYELINIYTYSGNFPMMPDKGDMADGGTLQNKISHINETYKDVTASKAYSSNRVQVVSESFNTLNEIKSKEFNGSGLIERYGNMSSLYVLYSNEIYASGGTMAKGGGVAHGLKVGDFIHSERGKMLMVQNGSEAFQVNIETGERRKRMEDGGNVTLDSKTGNFMSDGGAMTLAKDGIFTAKVKSQTHRTQS